MIREVPELLSVFGRAGSNRGRSAIFGGRFSGPHTGNLRVRLVPHKDRTRSSFNIMDDLRPMLANFPGARVTMNPGGIVSTFMTLIFIPTLYTTMEGLRERVESRKAKGVVVRAEGLGEKF